MTLISQIPLDQKLLWTAVTFLNLPGVLASSPVRYHVLRLFRPALLDARHPGLQPRNADGVWYYTHFTSGMIMQLLAVRTLSMWISVLRKIGRCWVVPRKVSVVSCCVVYIPTLLHPHPSASFLQSLYQLYMHTREGHILTNILQTPRNCARQAGSHTTCPHRTRSRKRSWTRLT